MPTSLTPLTATFLSTLFVFNLLTVTPVFSWFDKGHRIVGLIAQANLSAEARKEIEKILPGYMTLAEAAIWPDHEGRSIRDFDPLHYVTIPETASGYDQARDCPERNCMVEALKWFSTVVADKNAPIMMRRLALHYVAHLVGDMHQPLHAGQPRIQAGPVFVCLTEARRRIFTSSGTQTWWRWKPGPKKKSPSGLLQISRKRSVLNGRPAIPHSGPMNR